MEAVAFLVEAHHRAVALILTDLRQEIGLYIDGAARAPQRFCRHDITSYPASTGIVLIWIASIVAGVATVGDWH